MTEERNMDSYQYEAIIEDQKKNKYKPLLRQLLVTSSPWIVVFVTGFGFGAPTVFIPQIRREANSTDAVSKEMASWLCNASSVFSYSALPFIVVVCSLMPIVGRKTLFMLLSINSIIFHLVLYFSTNTTHLLISEILQGINHATNCTLVLAIVSEYTSPKYRGIFLTLKSATFFWGVWCANAIGTFFHWKYIPLSAIVLLLFNFTIVFWPESPHWLASRGRFEECAKSYFWLMGKNETTKKELEHLIDSQKKFIKIRRTKLKIMEVITNKSFYKPTFICVTLMLHQNLSGKYVCAMYALDIIKQITGSESAAYYGMLLLDGVTVAGMYCGSFLSKVVKRRTLLMTTGLISELVLCLLALYLYLINLGLLSENRYATACLLVGFSVTVSMGPVIILVSVAAELIPINYKSYSLMIVAISHNTTSGIILKLSPYIFASFGMHGTFFFFGLASGLCFVILYFYLPETKDKTLQEIEDMFDDNKNKSLM